jgi:hypothetical protein
MPASVILNAAIGIGVVIFHEPVNVYLSIAIRLVLLAVGFFEYGQFKLHKQQNMTPRRHFLLFFSTT